MTRRHPDPAHASPVAGRRAAQGFTLVELMIVVGILGVLSAFALPAYRDYLDRSRAAAFLVQLDGWRERAAVASQAMGADLCRWDESRFGPLRQEIFARPSMQAAGSFNDYQLDLAAHAAAAAAPGQPFVVSVLATASGGVHALNVARQLRRQLTQLGLLYPAPGQDIDLPTVQAFSVLLGNCPGLGTTVAQTSGAGTAVAALVHIDPPKPPIGATMAPAVVTLPASQSTPKSPVPPASEPGTTTPPPGERAPTASGPQTPGLPVLAGGGNPQGPALPPGSTSGGQPPTNAPDQPSQPQAQAQVPAQGPVGGQAPVSGSNARQCRGGQQWSAAQQACECTVGHWNPNKGACVGNNVNGRH